MDKQRLMELAGVLTEAKIAGDAGSVFVVVVVDWENGDIESVSGPFNNRNKAEMWAGELAAEIGWTQYEIKEKIDIIEVNRV